MVRKHVIYVYLGDARINILQNMGRKTASRGF